MEETTQQNSRPLNAVALSATVHCLTGCAIGEILGMVIGSSFGLDMWTTVVISVVLAFIFGYSFTLVPLVRSGMGWALAVKLALASDSVSIAIMEVIDNALMMVIPGAMDAGPASLLFWGSMALSLGLAGAAAFPVNRWLIARGRGHAVVHAHHGGTAVPVEKDETMSGHHGHH